MDCGVESRSPIYHSYFRGLLVSRTHLRHPDERVRFLICLAHDDGSCYLQRQRGIRCRKSTAVFLPPAAGFRHGVYDWSSPSILRHPHARPVQTQRMVMLLALIALRPRLHTEEPVKETEHTSNHKEPELYLSERKEKVR